MFRFVSIACGVLYLITQPWQPFPASFEVKGLSIAALGLHAFFSRGGERDVLILGAALILSSVGDVLLDLDPRGLFIYGLGAFLIVHLVYAFLFARNWPRLLRIGPTQTALIILVLVYSVVVSTWLVPGLGNLTVPVVLYICAITAMVVAAILAGFSTPWVVVGAILFLVSDSLLAVNKFKTPVPYRDYLVWATYYAGQYAIATGYVSHASGSAPNVG